MCSVYAVISSPYCGGGQVEQSELKLRKSPEQIQQRAEHQIKIPYRKGGWGSVEAREGVQHFDNLKLNSHAVYTPR